MDSNNRAGSNKLVDDNIRYVAINPDNVARDVSLA